MTITLPMLPRLTATDPAAIQTWSDQLTNALERLAQLRNAADAQTVNSYVATTRMDAGSFSGTTDASGQLVVSFNIVAGKTLFRVAPVVLVANGDSTAGPTDIVSVVTATITASGFTAKFSNPSTTTASVPRRVNWIAIGSA